MLYDYSHYTYDYTVNYKTLRVAIMFSSGRKLPPDKNLKSTRTETVNRCVCRWYNSRGNVFAAANTSCNSWLWLKSRCACAVAICIVSLRHWWNYFKKCLCTRLCAINSHAWYYFNYNNSCLICGTKIKGIYFEIKSFKISLCVASSIYQLQL